MPVFKRIVFKDERLRGPEQPLDPRALSRLRKSYVACAFALTVIAMIYGAWHIHHNYVACLEQAKDGLNTRVEALQLQFDAMLSDGLGAAISAVSHMDDSSLEQWKHLLQEDMKPTGPYVAGMFVDDVEHFWYVDRQGALSSSTERPSWLRCGAPSCVFAPILEPKVYLPIVRRVANKSGRTVMAGVVFDLSEVSKRYSGLQIDDGVIGLFASNQLLMLSTSHEGILVDELKSIPQREARTRELLRKINGTVHDAHPQVIEGYAVRRGQPILLAAREVTTGDPLIVAINLPKKSVLAPWRQSTFYIVVGTGAVTALMLVVMWLMYRFVREINQREQQFLKLFETSMSAILLLKNSRVFHGNEAAFRMFHATPEQLIGKHTWELSVENQPDGRSSQEAAIDFRTRAERGEGPTRFPWLYKRQDTDDVFECEVSLSSVRVGADFVTLAIVNDVSEIVKARRSMFAMNQTLEERVKQRTRELEDSNKRLLEAHAELEAFTAAASHDLRSPLTTISGQAGLLERALQDYQLPLTARQRFGKINDAVRRSTDVINGLLALARVTRAELTAEQVDLSVFANQALSDLRDTQPERKVECTIESPLMVHADAGLMRSLVVNLISNAWKYSGKIEQARISLATLHRGNEIVYFVRDNGAGFDMDKAKHLFGAFRRLHDKTEFQGTGIGLATVQRIVKRYGGSIWAEAAPGKGATFYFTLPQAQLSIPTPERERRFG